MDDGVSVKKEGRKLPCFIEAREEMVNSTPTYLARSRKDMSVKLLYLPKREEILISCEMPLVIEYYSR